MLELLGCEGGGLTLEHQTLTNMVIIMVRYLVTRLLVQAP